MNAKHNYTANFLFEKKNIESDSSVHGPNMFKASLKTNKF